MTPAGSGGRFSPPGAARALVERVLPVDVRESIAGDLDEFFQRDCRTHGPGRARRRYWRHAAALTFRFAVERGREGSRHLMHARTSWMDLKLGLRMLVKYPGLTFAGGLAIAIAIGLGAGWYDVSRDFFRPAIPLPEGDRIVEIEMRNPRIVGDEQRLLHDFAIWRQELESVEELGAYRTLERPLSVGGANPEPVRVAEISASAFRLVRVPPILGRPLLESDEAPGAPGVVVLGYDVWQRRFGGARDVIGQDVPLGPATSTVVGVMPEGFAFPINHRAWVPLPRRPSGYAPLEGPAVRIFGRIAPGATQERANEEVAALTDRVRAASPRTHEHLRPRVLAYGGEAPGDRASVIELVVRHGPVLLVLLVACLNVATLIYARTATREAEIALRSSLGATRRHLIMQLFVEALVLAGVSATIGVAAAHRAVAWGVTAYYSTLNGGAPFWIEPGLKPRTIGYAIVLAIASAAILGVLPAIKATGIDVQAHLRQLAAGSTLRFGRVWTTAMIGQVAVTVICIPPAMGIGEEAWRDRRIRGQFPGHEYLAVRIGLDQEMAAGESDAAFAERADHTYAELERRLEQEVGVTAVTFAEQLPGMQGEVRRGELDTAAGSEPVPISTLWTATVAPTFFAAFDRPIVAGRGFTEGDVSAGARNVVVNEAFARRFTKGASPVGRRVRYAIADAAAPEEWLEIVGVVRDIGTSPTDLGEAPFVFQAARPRTMSPLTMGIRVADPANFSRRVRAIASTVDPGVRLEEMRPLDDWMRRIDLPAMVSAWALAAVVALGLFLSAAGIFALMSVMVARRTREIGLRSALGAGRGRLLAAIFSRAVLLVGGGILAGNLFILAVVSMGDGEAGMWFVVNALVRTSGVMLVVGLLACVEPARRALTIDPTTALRHV
jgi:predicted permease